MLTHDTIQWGSACRAPEASPGESAQDAAEAARPSQGTPERPNVGQGATAEAGGVEPETLARESVASWPRSRTDAEGRPSLFAAFPAAGQPRQVWLFMWHAHTSTSCWYISDLRRQQ